MYPQEIVIPMIQELTSVGFKELKTPQDVDVLLAQKGTTLLVINSVCGCAARNARPAVIKALKESKIKPNNIATAFAGVDKEAVQRAREYMLPYPPSSPSIALFKDGKLVHMIERHHIEGRPVDMISQNLILAFEEHCQTT
jgi:putative YphP/YqiW family bacilliredoxin